MSEHPTIDAQREGLEDIAAGNGHASGGEGATGRRFEPPRPDDKGKFILPPVPELGDNAGLCEWLTIAAFNLDPKHPIVRGERKGARGPEGRVELYRAGAPLIRFEPAKHINTPIRLIEALSSQELPSDGRIPPFKSAHAGDISFAIRRLCGTSETISDADEAAGIVSTYMMVAKPVEGRTTYGNSGQRYEAAVAVRRPLDEQTGRAIGPPRYLIDANTGELVMAVSDLQEAARRHTGSSLPRGWLDGRMDTLGWQRITDLDESDDAAEAREDLERAQARVKRLKKSDASEAESDLGEAIDAERAAAERYLEKVPSAVSEEREREAGERGEDRTEKALRELDEDRAALRKADQPTQERARWAKASLGREYLQKSVSALSDPSASAAIDRIRQIEGRRGA